MSLAFSPTALVNPPPSSTHDAWDGPILRAGGRFLGSLARPLDDADPRGLLSAEARALGGAFGLVSQLCYAARGGGERSDDVGLVGAQLALLAELDDAALSAPSFHKAGWGPGREALSAKAKDALEPTRLSLRTGRPASDTPRAHFAATLGLRLTALAASNERLERLFDVVEEGLRAQAEAVAVLSASPHEVSLAEVAAATARVGGVRLLSIALAGTLPADALPFAPELEPLFDAWGFRLRRASSLASLASDLNNGLGSTYPLRLLWACDPALYCRTLGAGPAEVYETLGALGLDRDCLPEPGELDALARRSQPLGHLPSLFRWVHGLLIRCYTHHPLARPAATLKAASAGATFERFIAGAASTDRGAPRSKR